MPAIRGANSKSKTRRMTRGIDQVSLDLTDPKSLRAHQIYTGASHTDPNAVYGDSGELPGGGQHYCIECAKWFDSDGNLVAHQKGKVHKRRVKEIKLGAVSQREVEEAVGLGRDEGVVTRREKEGKMDVKMGVGESAKG